MRGALVHARRHAVELRGRALLEGLHDAFEAALQAVRRRLSLALLRRERCLPTVGEGEGGGVQPRR